VVVDLTAVDVDEIDPSNSFMFDPSFADSFYAKITAWPVFGELVRGHRRFL